MPDDRDYPLYRNPNIDFPEGSGRFTPSERLLRQMQLYGGPKTSRFPELLANKERPYTTTVIEAPRQYGLYGWHYGGDKTIGELNEDNRSSTLEQLAYQEAGLEDEDSGRGIYVFSNNRGRRSLATFAHEALHASDGWLSETSVRERVAFFSPTLEDLIASGRSLKDASEQFRSASKKRYAKEEGNINTALAFLEDNFLEMAKQAAVDEAVEQKREDGDYDLSPPLRNRPTIEFPGLLRLVQKDYVGEDSVISYLSDLDVRIARWKRDSEKGKDQEAKEAIPRMSKLQRNVREEMGKLLDQKYGVNQD